MTTSMTVDKMKVTVFESNEALGRAAASDFADIIKREVEQRGEAAAILATGNSQLSFVNALQDQHDIPWDKVYVLHMDEYVGMSILHPASFRRFLKEKITDPFKPLITYGIEGDSSNIEGELSHYTELLDRHSPVVCVMGIGENGHLAFNDPPADFNTDKAVHVVTLDAVCRQQQVGEGHFASIDDVPRQAISLTVPALLKPPHVMVLVPEARKAAAVQDAFQGPVTEDCPASILKTQAHVHVYLDPDSSARLDRDSNANSQ
jgi:glucosamine-6-phosphate deaminase